MKINMLSKEELQELKNMLNNKDLMKLAEEVRDNNLENLLETRENQINEMEATQNTYTEAKAGRTYHK